MIISAIEGDKMIKGSKRQIIFLQDLKKTCGGVFESAYFILNSDAASDVSESVMLLEAERIVAETQKFMRRYERSCSVGEYNDSCRENAKEHTPHPKDVKLLNTGIHRKSHSIVTFVFGALFGAAVLVLAHFILACVGGLNP